VAADAAVEGDRAGALVALALERIRAEVEAESEALGVKAVSELQESKAEL
jgi:hypothetical protein